MTSHGISQQKSKGSGTIILLFVFCLFLVARGFLQCITVQTYQADNMPGISFLRINSAFMSFFLFFSFFYQVDSLPTKPSGSGDR